MYDVDDLIACAMPWHGTAEFVKVAQTCQLENSKHFKWLAGVKETGAAPPRDALAVRCSKDKAFFTFCAQSAAEMATTKVRNGVSRRVDDCLRLRLRSRRPLWLKRPITPSRAFVYSNRDGSSTGVVYLIARSTYWHCRRLFLSLATYCARGETKRLECRRTSFILARLRLRLRLRRRCVCSDFCLRVSMCLRHAL